MIRLIWFITKFAAVILLAVWLAEHPGAVNISWQNYEISTSVAFLLVCVFILVAASLLAYRLLRLFRYGPRGMKLRRQLHKQRLGLQRLEAGLTAIASGDAKEAGKQAVTARKLLGHAPIAQWLQAQAAQLAGDHAVAEQIFTLLSKELHTAAIGYRGLIAAALRNNDLGKAATLVEELAAKRPKTPWLQVARYELAVRQGAWAQAATALRLASAQRLLEPAAARMQEAALLIAEARAAIVQNQLPRAMQAAEQAIRQEPNWLPARIALVQTQQASGYGKIVIKKVEKFWETTPHPELGALYLQQFGMLPPLKRFKRVEQLTARAPNHPVSLLLLAETAMAAELWGEALRHLQRAAERAPTRQVYRLLAELAEKERHDQKATLDWLQRAAAAPVEAGWRCGHCGHGTQQWEITCPQCGTMSRIEWTDPHGAPKLAAPDIAHDALLR